MVAKKKKVKKNIQSGIAHIQSTFNNTVITITDVGGNAISWASCGQHLIHAVWEITNPHSFPLGATWPLSRWICKKAFFSAKTQIPSVVTPYTT